MNAFQAGSASESVLKVETKGGELDLILVPHPHTTAVIVLTKGLPLQTASLPNLSKSLAKAVFNSPSSKSETPTPAYPRTF